MTLKDQLEQWINSNKILQIMFKKNATERTIVGKLMRYDEENQYIITYDLDHKQVHNIGLYELEDINEYSFQ